MDYGCKNAETALSPEGNKAVLKKENRAALGCGRVM
jgi:hypothetical protein